MRAFPTDRGGVVGLACVLLALLSLNGCGPSEQQALADARQELADAAYAEAVAVAESGLRVASDARTSWGLELVKLEALARVGNAEETLEQLARLSRLHPDRVPPTQYSATASQLRSAGQGPAAIEALDMGIKRYPSDAALAQLITSAGSSDVDPAELEMLKSLGYID